MSSLPACYRCKQQPCTCADGITLYWADCRDVLPPGESTDSLRESPQQPSQEAVVEPAQIICVTDPPYGINHASNRPGAPRRGRAIAGDETTAVRDAVLSQIGHIPFVVFGRWNLPPFHADIRGVLVWDKGGHVGMGDLSFPWKQNWECIFIGGDGFAGRRGPGVLRHLAIAPWANKLLHPHQKPVSLFVALLEKCPAGIILDPFAGSGTTLVAAKQLGRKAIGVEIDEKYCEIAARRLEQEVLFT